MRKSYITHFCIVFATLLFFMCAPFHASERKAQADQEAKLEYLKARDLLAKLGEARNAGAPITAMKRTLLGKPHLQAFYKKPEKSDMSRLVHTLGSALGFYTAYNFGKAALGSFTCSSITSTMHDQTMREMSGTLFGLGCFFGIISYGALRFGSHCFSRSCFDSVCQPPSQLQQPNENILRDLLKARERTHLPASTVIQVSQMAADGRVEYNEVHEARKGLMLTIPIEDNIRPFLSPENPSNEFTPILVAEDYNSN